MKWTTVAGLVALASLGLVAKAVLAPREVPPRDVLERLRPILDDPGLEPRPVLDVLGRALRHPDAREDDALSAEILTLRADLFRRLGAYSDAREALDRIRVVLDRTTPELDLETAELLALEGQPLEAWQRVRAVLETHPDHGPAWGLRGELERAQAEVELEVALDRIDRALAGEDARRAEDLARQLAHRDPSDPERVRLASELRELHTSVHQEPAAAAALEALERASERMRTAREAFARAVEHGRTGTALEHLLELLDRAGAGALAADLGVASTLNPDVVGDWRVLRPLVAAMLGQGQVERAAHMLEGTDLSRGDIDLDFLRQAASIQFRALDWRGLGETASALTRRGTGNDQAAASWYQAWATFYRPAPNPDVRRQNLPRVATFMEAYLDSDRPLYEPNMPARAHALRAQVWRELGEERLERVDLIGAVQEDPALDAELWMRLAELQRETASIGYRIPVENVTRALALAPQRTAEWMDTWVRYGEADLASQNLSEDAAWRRARNSGRDLSFAGPHTRWLVARRALAEGEAGLALTLARDLYQDYEGLLPALDLQIEARLAMDMRAQAAPLLIDRLRLAGPDAEFRALLVRTGTDVLSDDDYLELLRHDPAGEGRLALAARALEEEDPERALRVLRPEPEEGAAPIPLQDVLRAEAYLDLGVSDRAAEAAARALDAEHLAEEAWSLYLQALLAAPPARLEEAVGAYLEREWIEVEGALEACDRLLAGSRPAQALRLVRYLDEVPEARERHGGEVCARLALCAELLGDRALRDESLERAEAFLSDGRVELSRLVLALLEKTWTRVPGLVAELRTTTFEPTPMQEAVLALLEERLQDAQRLVAEAAGDPLADPSWALVHGAGLLLRRKPVELPPHFGPEAVTETEHFLVGTRAEPRDPREGLALLLALEVEGWGLWVLPRVVEAARRGGGTLWPLYLGTRAQEALGQAANVLAGRRTLVEDFPGFTPGWDLLERTELERAGGDSLAPEVLDVRVRRLAAVGDVVEDPPLRRGVDRAASLHAAGDVPAAMRLLNDLAREPEGHEARWLLGRFLRHARRPEEALGFQKVALELLPPDRLDPHVPEILETLEEARTTARRTRLSAQDALAVVRDLEAHEPRDPDLALTRLALAIELDPAGTSLAVSRTRGALDELRERTDGVYLEDLRAGSALRWARFLRPLSPSLAEEFLARELPARPGSMPLWVERARVWADLGRHEQARVLLERMTAASDDPEAHLELALLLARRGGSVREVDLHVAAARPNLVGSERQRAMFVGARAHARLADNRLPRTIRELETLWVQRANHTAALSPLELGWTYVSALAERAAPEDRALLPEVAGELRALSEGLAYQESAARALVGLVAGIPTSSE